MAWFDFLSGKDKKKATSNASKTITKPEEKEQNGNELWLEAINEPDDKKSESLFLKAEEWAQNKIDLHFIYLGLYQLYYRRREQWPTALEKCIEYCIKDIDIYPQFIQEYMKESNVAPRVPAFQQLAIIYEKQGEYKEAIEICKLAIKYGQKERTKSGYHGRIESLEKKLNRKRPDN